MPFRKEPTSGKWLNQKILKATAGTGVAIGVLGFLAGLSAPLGFLADLSQFTGLNLKDVLSSINRVFGTARQTVSRYQGHHPFGEKKPIHSVPSGLKTPIIDDYSKRSSDPSICNRVLDLVAKAASGDWASEAQAMLDIEEIAKTNPLSFDRSVFDQASSKFDQGVSSRPQALSLIKKAFNCTR